MERIPDHKILKYNADTLIALRKIYNLDKPGQMDEAIDLLDAWVKKQSHFVRKDFSREYLERVIILIKGSVERAKGQLDRICTLRTLLPHFFEKCNAKNDLKIVREFQYSVLLPRLTKDHIRILFLKYMPLKYTPKFLLHVYFYHILLGEYLKAHDYSNGVSIVVDLRDVNIMDLASQINLVELKQICTIFLKVTFIKRNGGTVLLLEDGSTTSEENIKAISLRNVLMEMESEIISDGSRRRKEDIDDYDFILKSQLQLIHRDITEGFDMRVKNFLFISSSKAIEIPIKLLKQMLSEKLGQRIHILKEAEGLYEYIPKEMLPSDYGGDEKPLAELQDDLIEELSTEANVKYFREMSKARTNESLRTSKKYCEDFSGIAGTFRTLSVD